MTASPTREALDRTIRLCQGVIFMPGAATDEAVADALLATRVAIVADERNLACGAGQSAVVALARLALGYGCSVKLVMPDVALAGHQPPLRGKAFRAALVDCGNDIIPGVSTIVADTTEPDELVFVLGDTVWRGSARAAWRLTADPWAGGIVPIETSIPRFETDFPVGALAAAALASAEPFKAAMRGLGAPLRVVEQVAMVQRASRRLVPAGTSISPVDLGAFDCVSGGAIMNAALFALLRVPGVRGDARVFEPQVGELSNLNRYVLMRLSTAHLPKVEMLAEWQLPALALHGAAVEVTEATISALAPLRPRVLVGVDRVPARWLVQRQWPSWLGVAGTDDFLVQASEHAPGLRCAGCAYFDAAQAVGQPIATVSFVSFWAGLLLAARMLRQTLGAPSQLAEQMSELTALRLDSPIAARSYRVPHREDCAVDCRRVVLATAA